MMISAPVEISATYQTAEQELIRLLELDDLDYVITQQPSLTQSFEQMVSQALEAAYGSEEGDAEAHRFLQRILYRINRLNLFWYDDLHHYTNERSVYLQMVRNQIEDIWQVWELSHLDVLSMQELDLESIKQTLVEKAAIDVNPPLSASDRFYQEEMDEAGYRRLLAIASFDGLVEGSRLSRILGGAPNEVQCTLIRVLLEEYGNGRYSRKHSTFFAQMLEEFGMNTEPEGYFDLVPWEVLACANHNFLMTERKIHFLRYCGGLTVFEVAGPVAYRNYLKAAQRLQLSDAAMGYWELHIREDERHGQWMLKDVALPLCDRYADDAWQILLGYEQEKFMGDRASVAVIRAIKSAEYAVLAS